MQIKTFFCEEISSATYGRDNIYGANFSETLSCPTFPYRLHTTFITLVDLDAKENLKKISQDLLIDEVVTRTFSAEGPGECLKNIRVRIQWSKLDLVLHGPGIMKIRVNLDTTIREQTWNIILGEGAHRASQSTLPPVLLIDGRSENQSPLYLLINEARFEILIADQYLTNDFLQELLATLAKNKN
jgi:hypothetical protein